MRRVPDSRPAMAPIGAGGPLLAMRDLRRRDRAHAGVAARPGMNACAHYAISGAKARRRGPETGLRKVSRAFIVREPYARAREHCGFMCQRSCREALRCIEPEVVGSNIGQRTGSHQRDVAALTCVMSD